jgi:hypothetical protein
MGWWCSCLDNTPSSNDVISPLAHVYPLGMQVLATWALRVAPSGMSLRGPDISLDICLLAVSDETAGLDITESMSVGLSDPLG